MVVASRPINNTSNKSEAQRNSDRYLPNWSTPSAHLSNLDIKDLVAGEDFYQQINSFSDTIISFQYNSDEFLTFKVCNAEQGYILRSGTKAIGLRCQIGDQLYTFNREHLSMMSNRERNELFKQLGVNGNQLLQD